MAAGSGAALLPPASGAWVPAGTVKVGATGWERVATGGCAVSSAEGLHASIMNVSETRIMIFFILHPMFYYRLSPISNQHNGRRNGGTSSYTRHAPVSLRPGTANVNADVLDFEAIRASHRDRFLFAVNHAAKGFVRYFEIASRAARL
jgi:hypothetical protein